MQIRVCNTVLRFYEEDGWTLEKVQSYLVDKNHKVAYASDLKFFAVYENGGHKVFKGSLTKENKFKNLNCLDIVYWYVDGSK